MNVLIEENKKIIAIYPIFIFYLFIGWFVLFIWFFVGSDGFRVEKCWKCSLVKLKMISFDGINKYINKNHLADCQWVGFAWAIWDASNLAQLNSKGDWFKSKLKADKYIK